MHPTCPPLGQSQEVSGGVRGRGEDQLGGHGGGPGQDEALGEDGQQPQQEGHRQVEHHNNLS